MIVADEKRRDSVGIMRRNIRLALPRVAPVPSSAPGSPGVRRHTLLPCRFPLRRGVAAISLSLPTPLPRISLRARTDRDCRGRATICAVVAIVATLVIASPPLAPLGAQAVIGFGDDATTLPAGMVRLGVVNEWMRFDQRFTAPDGARIEADARVRSTPITLEIGVLDRLTVGAMVPSVGTFGVVTYYPSGAVSGHADSLRMFGQSAVGDTEVWAKLVWLGEQSEIERTQPKGVHVRSAFTGLVRLGTGTPAHPSHQFAIGTGDSQTDVEAASQWDFIFGRRFWMSLAGRYVRQLPTTRVVRVAPRDDPFTSAELVNTRIEPGNYYELEATPRLSLGQHFMLGARYIHRHDAATSYAAAGAAAGSADPSVLDVESSSAIIYGFGVVYSSVASYAARRTSIPVEVTLRYTRMDRWLDGVPPGILAEPERSALAVGVRLYAPLWGKR